MLNHETAVRGFFMPERPGLHVQPWHCLCPCLTGQMMTSAGQELGWPHPTQRGGWRWVQGLRLRCGPFTALVCLSFLRT